MSRNTEQDISAELSYEAALSYLTNPKPSLVDSENLIDCLSEIKNPTREQAQIIVDAAAQRATLWVQATDSCTVLDTLIPFLDKLRQTVEAVSDQKEIDAFTSTASQVAAGIISADFEAYPTYLRSLIEGNRLGNKGQVLAGILSKTLPHYKDSDDRQFDEVDEQEADQIATILDDLIQTDPDLAQSLKPELSPFLLLVGQDLPTNFPRVHQMLSESLSPQEIHRALADAYQIALTDSEKDQLRDRIKGGEFGDPFDVFSHVCTLAVTDESGLGDNDLAQDTWIEVLEINRSDPRLRPLRSRLMSQEWYWDSESIIYTLMDTISSFSPKDEPQVVSLIDKHQEDIVSALRRNIDKSDWIRYGDGIETTMSRGELPGRLSALLSEIRDIATENPEFATHFSDSLLLACLHTPSQKAIAKKPVLQV